MPYRPTIFDVNAVKMKQQVIGSNLSFQHLGFFYQLVYNVIHPINIRFFTNMASHYTITNRVIRYDVSLWSLRQILTMLFHFPFFVMPFSTNATTNLPFYVLFSYVFSTVHEIYTFCRTDHICSINHLRVLSSVTKCACRYFLQVVIQSHSAHCQVSLSCVCTWIDKSDFLMKLQPQFCAMQK